MPSSGDGGLDGSGPPGDPRRLALLGLLVILVLVAVSYFLVVALHRNAKLEDCLMSGRRNCAPIETPSRQ
jgi:hypothetical protein